MESESADELDEHLDGWAPRLERSAGASADWRTQDADVRAIIASERLTDILAECDRLKACLLYTSPSPRD